MLDLFFETSLQDMIVSFKIKFDFFYDYHLNARAKETNQRKKMTYLPSQFTSAVSVHTRKTKSVMESMLKIRLNSLVKI